MATKKKKKSSIWKKAAKAAALAAAAYGASKMFGGARGSPIKNVHETGAIAQTPGRERWGPGVGGKQHVPITPAREWMPHDEVFGGGVAFKKGGSAKKAKVTGIAKRGFGRALMKGKK